MANNFKSAEFTRTAGGSEILIDCTIPAVIVNSVYVSVADVGTAEYPITFVRLDFRKTSQGSQRTIAIIKKNENTGILKREYRIELLDKPVILNAGDRLTMSWGAMTGGGSVSCILNYMERTAELGSANIGELNDVSATTPVDGQALVWSGSAWTPTATAGTITSTDALTEGSSNLYFTDARADFRISVASIKNLGDVYSSMSPSDGQVLTYDTTNGWQAETPSGGGGGGLAAIVDDDSPQLGEDLDVNGYAITSVSNGDVELDPNGSGNVIFVGNATRGAGQFKLNCENNSHAITIEGPPHSAAANYTLTLPDDDGTNGQVLSTDGSGRLSWVDNSGGGGGGGGGNVNTSGTPSDNQLAVFTNSNTVEGDVNLTWDADLDTLSVAGTIASNEIGITLGTGVTASGNYGKGSRVLNKFGTNTQGTQPGDVYYLSSGGWSPADADSASSASGLLAVATGSASQDGMLACGLVRMDDNTNFSSASTGAVLYLDTATGNVTATAPSGPGDIVRVVGYVFNAANKIIYFDPDKTWLEL